MYIHQAVCISPQKTFYNNNLILLSPSVGNKLSVIEPDYKEIPRNLLRRMGKAVRMGVGAAWPIIQKAGKVDGVIIGTENGGQEECIKFLNQIIEYKEGTLTPTNFVQGTPNAIASQISTLSHNTGYNATHVHRGLSFETALLDVLMLLEENPDHQYLAGGVDETSEPNFNMDYLDGWYKAEPTDNAYLYESETSGSIAGEGGTMFLMKNSKEGAKVKVEKVSTLHSTSPEEVEEYFNELLRKHPQTDLLISGENGDIRTKEFYKKIENRLAPKASVFRFKHMAGEYGTATAFAVWLVDYFFSGNPVADHMIKTPGHTPLSEAENVLIYNMYKGKQHSFIFLSRV